MPKRHTIQKIEPSRPDSFDQHFWPVLVAMCVLCGIAFGAILTLMRGPWMWGSLLFLPALAAASILFLYRLDDTRLRRSIQLAILVSLAAHMLILLIASVTNIFENNFRPPQQQVANRKTKTIKVSNSRIPKVWERSNQKEAPDPVVEVEKQPTQAVRQPQPVPVRETQEKHKPQITRRESPSRTVPRLDTDLSKLKRQERNLAPRSSTQAKVRPAVKKTPTKSNSQEQKISVSRQPSRTESPKSTRQKTASKQQPTTANQSAIATRNRQIRSEVRSRDSDPSTRSTARIRKSSPRVPELKPRQTNSVVASKPTQRQQTENKPSKSANQIVRRPTRSTVASPSQQDNPKTTLSPSNQIARSAQRREIQVDPSISKPNITERTPRRSDVRAPLATTKKVEAPSRSPDSQTPSRELNAKTLSVSRGELGVAGAGASRNMERDTGGTTSPAVRASDSASRRRTESRPAPMESLSPSQKSIARRSIAQTQLPTSAFKANTDLKSKITGSKDPAKVTAESSAANIDAASADHRSTNAASKGNSNADIGATKIVADKTAERRSGGGQPNVAELNPESTRRSNSRSSERVPTLAETQLARTAAANSADSAEPSSSAEPSPTNLAQMRQGGESPLTRDTSSAIETGVTADQGTSPLADLLADARQRSESNAPVSGNADDEDDEELNGKRSSKLAQAPLVRDKVAMGDSRHGGGVRDTESENESESLASSVIERAAGKLAGSLSRSTASQLFGAAASLPLVDPGPPSAAAKRASRNPNPNVSESLTAAETESRIRSTDRSPTFSPTAIESEATRPDSSNSELVMDAADFTVERTLDSNQVGAAVDVQAPEGAAGLGEVASLNLGVRKRPASAESESIQLDDDNRFRRDEFGSSLAVVPNVTLAKKAFRSRKLPSQSGNEPMNERAIELGLEFLARHQLSDGSWALSGFDRDHAYSRKQLNSNSAATGLALLAFQGAGYNHREFKYARQMNHAIMWLTENQLPDGALYKDSGFVSDQYCRFYSHGIATLALTEAYGMTQDPELKRSAQLAIDYIVKTQDPKRGGWRYFADKRRTDTSVTGWMLMALKSGQLAGLDVPKPTLDRISEWLDVAADPMNTSTFRYDPFSKQKVEKNRSQGKTVTPSMTAVGLLMQIYSGMDRTDPRLEAGASYLLNNLMPSDASMYARDTYYWYYATQVLLHLDGPSWQQWESALHPLLVNSQVQTGDMSGSWDPYSPVPDRWGVQAGRLYVTAMNLLSLEVKNRKLPLYDESLKGDPQRDTSLRQ